MVVRERKRERVGSFDDVLSARQRDRARMLPLRGGFVRMTVHVSLKISNQGSIIERSRVGRRFWPTVTSRIFDSTRSPMRSGYLSRENFIFGIY